MSVAADERCTVCKRNFPLRGTICHPCSDNKQEQEQEQEEEQVQEQEEVYLSERPPAPVCCSAEEGPELHRLEEAHHLGELAPVYVQLGEMPPHAGRAMKSIAEHMRTRMGLRRAVGDERPLPYATSEAVRAGLALDQAAASRALNALVRAGVVEHVGQLKPRRGLDGTKLYAPPGKRDGRSTP